MNTIQEQGDAPEEIVNILAPSAFCPFDWGQKQGMENQND